MALVDTRGATSLPEASARRRVDDLPSARRPLRVGVINVMPRVEQYERFLLSPLDAAPSWVAPVWIRLRSHVYASSDRAHIERFYRTYEQAWREGSLDGLILTGAPVEELPFERVTYWPELSEILAHAHRHVRSTLGICWGGMALARILGIEKLAFQSKLFGVFPQRALGARGGLAALVGRVEQVDDEGQLFWCPQSRHSGVADDALERAAAADVVSLLAHGPDTGYGVFASPEGRFVMHLGHPEYEPTRLVDEWSRDSKLGRADVAPPRNLDLSAPADVWADHRARFFSAWLGIAAGR